MAHPPEHSKSPRKGSAMGTMAKSPLVVYGYTNYRKYLLDYYEFKKAGPRGFSYRSFSKAAGFSSPNAVKLIIEGNRNLGVESVPKIIKALGLAGPMAEYFKALVAMNQAPNDDEKQVFFNQMQKLIPHSKKRDLNAEGLRYLSHWLYPTIREMVEFSEFRDDPYWIARRLVFQASISEISQALKFLIEEMFIEKSPQGFKAGDQMVLSSDEVRSLAIRNYHRQMLDLARQSLESLPMEQREFGALTLNLPESALPELKFKLKEIRKNLHEWGLQVAQNHRLQGESHDSVTQINFQMFPLAKRGEKNP
jgi:uncharacterized protein (TIGR02147 family)